MLYRLHLYELIVPIKKYNNYPTMHVRLKTKNPANVGFENFEKLCSSGHKMATQEKHLDHIDMINTLRDYGLSHLQGGAERVGFEPTLRYKRKHAFQACAFSHSATSPKFICIYNSKTMKGSILIIKLLFFLSIILTC